MLSIELELADGGTVIYDNVVSYTVEEVEEIEYNGKEPSPDEVPEEGDEEREGNSEPDMTEETEEEVEEVEEETN